MYDTLLFLHVLSAFALVVTLVIFSAYVLGAPADKRSLLVATVMWAIGGAGTLILGVWLAIYVDGYEVWDGWILGAVALYAVATETGRRAQKDAVVAEAGDGATVTLAPDAARWHWLCVIATIGILILMIYKPGA